MTVSPIDAGLVITEEENSKQIIYQAAHHQFVASSLAVKACREIIPEAKIGMMQGYEPAYPKTCNPDDVLLAQQVENEMLFFSDVMVRGYYPNNIHGFVKDNNIEIAIDDSDIDLLKKYTVDYIAFSYYSKEVSFQIILHAGNAKSLAMEAISAAKEQDFEKAEALIEQCK